VRSRRTTSHGFTLIEAAFATVIVAVGVLSVMELFYAMATQNRQATRLTSAAMLATHIREICTTQPIVDPILGSSTFGPETGESLSSFDDIDDFNNASFNPAIDAQRNAIDEAGVFTQKISVVPVNSNNPGGNLAGGDIILGTYTGSVRVTVTILQRDGNLTKPVYSVNWIATRD